MIVLSVHAQKCRETLTIHPSVSETYPYCFTVLCVIGDNS